VTVPSQIPVILNPIAGGGRLLRRRVRLEEAARRQNVELVWWPTEHRGHGETLARQAAEQGFPLVFAFGGDGTYNEVARGLLGSSTALGPLPGGTTSVLVYEFEIGRPPERALEELIAGTDRKIRVGRTNRGEIFVLMLSAGPDTLVLANLGPRLKRLGGRVGVAAQAVVELLSRRSMPEFLIREKERVFSAGWAIIGNSRCYAGPFHATPGAEPSAAELQLVAQRRAGRRAALAFAFGLATGRHVRRKDVEVVTTKALTLEPTASTGPPYYQIDGDLVGELPVDVSVADEELVVRLPRVSSLNRDEEVSRHVSL
jgi:diacylglycerol kinase family enzyme